MHDWRLIADRKAALASGSYWVCSIREVSGRHRLPRIRPNPSVPWMRRLLGDSPVEMIVYQSASDPQLDRVRALFPEATVTHFYNVNPFHPPDDQDPWPWVVDVLSRP
jgi:hypothetical protein